MIAVLCVRGHLTEATIEYEGCDDTDYPHSDITAEGTSRNELGVRSSADELIGVIGLASLGESRSAELGYYAHGPHWNQGLATEAAQDIVRVGFETVGYAKLTSRYHADNPASGRVLAKLGLKAVGLSRLGSKSDRHRRRLSLAVARRPMHRASTSLGTRSQNAMKSSRIFVSVVALAAAACAPSSHILTGTPRPPISTADVKIYSAPPAQFQEIALLDAHSSSVFGTGGQKSIDKVIERLKTEAAQLGANGIILGVLSDRQTGSVGTGVGSDSYSRNSAVGVGVGGSLGIYKKTGKATAIYVPPDDSSRARQ